MCVSKVFGFGVVSAHSGLGLEQLRTVLLIRTRRHARSALRSSLLETKRLLLVLVVNNKEAADARVT